MTTTAIDGKYLTYPSLSATIFEVPEPKEISAKFVYNYFLSNERESTDTFVSPENFSRKGEKYARQVELQFTPLSAIIPNNPIASEIQLSNTQKVKMLQANKDKIMRETEFSNDVFMSMQLQDRDVSNSILAGIEATLLQKKIDANALSPLETVLKYASETTDNVDGQSILNSVDVDDGNEFVTIDPATGRPFEVQKSGDVDLLTFNMSVNKKFVGDIATTALKTPVSPAGSMFSGMIVELNRQQEEARKNKKSNIVAAADFTEVLNPVQTELIGIDDVFVGGNTVMGYRIRRTQVDDPTNVVDYFVENELANSFVDVEVLYGVEYKYEISVIYLVRFFGYQSNRVTAGDTLIESRTSPSIIVSCNEVTPPVPPDGLRFYLLQEEGLVIEWDYPVNPADDVKRFQVFRRSSVDVAFQLIGELDFDDSTILTDRKEKINDFVKTKLASPRTFFPDITFDVDSDYIYAVCSVDAHDLSSGYSEQFRVHFDKFSASLVVDFISEKNAPKPYPNFLLREQLTEDAIRDSRHNSLSCYFDPEYLKVLDGEGQEVDFLQVSSDNVSYKLQLIHLNMQQSIVADIMVK